MIRKIFRLALNIIFSKDPQRIKQLKLNDRYQLVWISEYVGRKITLRLWERSESAFFEKILQEDDICLDIGANIGYYTHLFASKVKNKGAVVSIEPLKHNACLIELNSIMNSTDKLVKVLCTAVSDRENSPLNFSTTADSAFSFVVSASNQYRIGSDHIKPGAKLTQIPSTTIDSILKKLGIEKIDIVKMDVEGFEYKVLKGMEEVLSVEEKRPRLMMIELLSEHLKYYESSIEEICTFLKQYGYTSKFLNKGVLNDYRTEHYDKFHNVFFVRE